MKQLPRVTRPLIYNSNEDTRVFMRRALSLTLWGIALLVIAVADLPGGDRAVGGQPSGNLETEKGTS
jgi:hypothetical protein